MNRQVSKAVRGELTPQNHEGGSLSVRLKGCSHCASNNLQAERVQQESGDLGDFNITCQVCLAQGPPAETLEEAARRWNLRA